MSLIFPGTWCMLKYSVRKYFPLDRNILSQKVSSETWYMPKYSVINYSFPDTWCMPKYSGPNISFPDTWCMPKYSVPKIFFLWHVNKNYIFEHWFDIFSGREWSAMHLLRIFRHASQANSWRSLTSNLLFYNGFCCFAKL